MRTIRLSGPGKNSLSTALMQKTLAELDAAGGDPVLLTGDGDAFSAGLNLKEIATLDAHGMKTFLGAIEDLVRALYNYPAPIVSFLNGHAIAGGCVLALATDMRVMTKREGVRIGLNEVALGLRFPPLTLAMIKNRLTGPAFERVVLEAALYLGPEAKELGLVDTFGEESDALVLLERLAGHPRAIYAQTKALIRPKLTISDAVQKEFLEETIPYWASAELKAKLAAVLQKK